MEGIGGEGGGGDGELKCIKLLRHHHRPVTYVTIPYPQSPPRIGRHQPSLYSVVTSSTTSSLRRVLGKSFEIEDNCN